jgi:hypothetical protein
MNKENPNDRIRKMMFRIDPENPNIQRMRIVLEIDRDTTAESEPDTWDWDTLLGGNTELISWEEVKKKKKKKTS